LPTGRLAGTQQELARNTVLAPGLCGFKPQRQANSLPVPEAITTTNDYKGGNPVTTAVVIS